ncbi:uncharacterized protein LOC123876406 isoform X2 [Maniola jurtina]|uniref:uncharacterized protein LOC123876406 isoform X2 n=1 Tax=Maniola jurtina TaxID=191418 RepID=UPI001E68A2D9|nr:uncharacterized protein LOC123876406 isoform X2 [Maniola jurtina]
MSCTGEEETTNFYRSADNNDSECSENFQKFITELFEKNGILNDLRAYLRGHIIDVLKSAETGAPPACQKHFTQRLELAYQALNMLIAEYLLRLEFSYSLSVFVSEIPLANMVFDFARNFRETADTNMSGLRFHENDVWSVLNYLGIKCDSVHASKIVDLYKGGESPLLYCILKCIPMYHKEPNCMEDVVTSDECLSSSVKSAESYDKPAKRIHRGDANKCKHYAFCKSCQTRLLRLKEKYKNRKMRMEKMFQQVQSVYEAEVATIKEEEERKIKRSIANHALQLQKCKEEMEESFKVRQQELERSVNQKKTFLWGLARALRDQHEHLTLAMRDVQYETKRLAEKESSIKTQLGEAEQILKKRGEEMRKQISEELLILEGQLETMKRERDSINKERDELEILKNTYEKNSKIMKHDIDETVDLKTHYNTLKDEMVILRKYIESTKLQSKSFIERGTVMDLGDGVMNNSVGVKGDDDDDRLKGSQVINDLKKQKNVNFSQSNLDEIYHQLSRSHSRSMTSGREDSATHIRGSDPDCGTCDDRLSDGYNRISEAVKSNHCDICHTCNRDEVLQLREENDRLKIFARQQREHIDALSSERERLQAHVGTNSRPRTAPSVMGNSYFSANRMNLTTSVNAFGCRLGAGEELNVFRSSEPRVLLPGDALPFIGVLRDRNIDTRRHLISTWRALRRRLSTHTHPRHGAPEQRSAQESTGNAEVNGSTRTTQLLNANRTNCTTLQKNTRERPQRIIQAFDKPREKSPKSVLREAKEKLKNNITKEPAVPRDKSPNAVLREAKMRLRKLEIEAEAVEKSYLDFRKRQTELREERQNLVLAENSMMKSVSQLELKPSHTLHRIKITENVASNDTFDYEKSTENLKKDFDKYLREYQSKFDIGQTHFQNKNSVVQRIKPIPAPYAEICKDTEEPKEKNVNYLEKPLTEFRKLYQTQNTKKRKEKDDFHSIPNSQNNGNSQTKSPNIPSSIEKPESDKSSELKIEKNKREIIRKIKDKQAELEILKQNINKIYPETSKPNQTDLDIPENIEMENLEDIDENAGNNKQAELEILKQNINKNFETSTPNQTELDISKNIIDSAEIENLEETAIVNENELTLQVEHVRETNNIGVTESKQDILLIVESTVDNREIDSSENENEEHKISTQMTIIMSPKENNSPKKTESPSRELNTKTEYENEEPKISTQITVMVSPKDNNSSTESKKLKKLTKLTNNDALNAIFDADNDKELSSVDMHLELVKEHLESEIDKDRQEEYLDDFSADVDNYYNSMSEGGKNSPISLPKTSEDDNFWDS